MALEHLLLTETHKYGFMVFVKTTFEIPDELFRKAKVNAAARGSTMKAYVTEALEAKVSEDASPYAEKPWMKGFGALGYLHEETDRINKVIEDEFSQVDQEDFS